MAGANPARTPTDEEIRTLVWLNAHGVPVVTSYGIDLDAGKVGNVRYHCNDVDLPKLAEGLRELIAPYQEHIDADHAALRRVWNRHGTTPGHTYCRDDGFSVPCPTRQAIAGDGE